MGRRRKQRSPRRFSQQQNLRMAYRWLEWSLQDLGVSRKTAEHTRKEVHAIAHTYWKLSTHFNHLLLPCPQPQKCTDPRTRVANGRSLLRLSQQLDERFEKLTPAVLDVLEMLSTHEDDVVQAAIDNPNIGHNTSILMPGQTMRGIIQDSVRLLDEYTSGFPLSEAQLLAKGVEGLPEDMAVHFGDTICTWMREDDEDLSARIDTALKTKEMPLLFDWLRKGQLMMPERARVERFARELKTINNGGGGLAEYQFAQRLGSGLQEALTPLADEKDSWPAIRKLIRLQHGKKQQLQDLDEQQANKLGQDLRTLGTDIIALPMLLEAGIQYETAKNALLQSAGAKLPHGERIGKYFLRLRNRPAQVQLLVNNIETVIQAHVDVDLIMHIKKSGALLRDRIRLSKRGQLWKPIALERYARERGAKGYDRFLQQLDAYSDAQVGDGLLSTESVDELIKTLQYEAVQARVRSHPRYGELAQLGAIALFERSPLRDHLFDELSAVPEPARKVLYQQPLLLARWIERTEQGRTVAITLDDHTDIRETVYQALTEKKVKEPTPCIRRILLHGEHLTPATVSTLSDRFGLPVVSVDRTAPLRQLKQVVSAGDLVVYHLPKGVRSQRANYVKAITENAQGSYVRIAVTNAERITDEIEPRIYREAS
ncbi:hypothetical protein GF342_00815 [Candidatus Woesearchaeota archaeon]|nr:hypothetical protein [Candidatus Woesearchaeota archaeon]